MFREGENTGHNKDEIKIKRSMETECCGYSHRRAVEPEKKAAKVHLRGNWRTSEAVF